MTSYRTLTLIEQSEGTKISGEVRLSAPSRLHVSSFAHEEIAGGQTLLCFGRHDQWGFIPLGPDIQFLRARDAAAGSVG